MPGTYIGPGESVEETARRCARTELGIELGNISYFTILNKKESPRFHDFVIVLRCDLRGVKPRKGEWFNDFPKDILVEYEPIRDQVRSMFADEEENIEFLPTL